MNKELNFKAGQEVAVRIKDFSNAKMRLREVFTLENMDKWIFDGVVTKAGRKYITAEFYIGEILERIQFSVEDEYNEREKAGGSDYKLYESKEDIIQEFKIKKLYSDIGDKFKNNNDVTYSLDQLEKIMAILQE